MPRRYRPYLVVFYVLFCVVNIVYAVVHDDWRLLQGVLIGFGAALILWPSWGEK